MNITVRREETEGDVRVVTEVTVNAPVQTVEEAIPIAAKLAEALAREGEGIVAGQILPRGKREDWLPCGASIVTKGA